MHRNFEAILIGPINVNLNGSSIWPTQLFDSVCILVYHFFIAIVCAQCLIQPPKLCNFILYLIYNTCIILVLGNRCRCARHQTSLRTLFLLLLHFMPNTQMSNKGEYTNAFTHMHTAGHTYTCWEYTIASKYQNGCVCAANVHVIVTLASRTSIPIGWTLDFYLPILFTMRRWRGRGGKRKKVLIPVYVVACSTNVLNTNT